MLCILGSYKWFLTGVSCHTGLKLCQIQGWDYVNDDNTAQMSSQKKLTTDVFQYQSIFYLYPLFECHSLHVVKVYYRLNKRLCPDGI